PLRSRSGCAVVPVAVGSVFNVTVNGCPVCCDQMPESCQSRTNLFAKPGDLPNGNCHTPLSTNRCVASKFDEPRFDLRLRTSCGIGSFWSFWLLPSSMEWP